MRIVTWNVNSLRVRLPRVLELLAQHRPDVVCLQETKTRPRGVPGPRACSIDREYRKGTKPSDHAPLLLDLAGAGN